MGRFGAGRARHRAPSPVGHSRWFNLLWLLPIGFVHPDHRGRRRQGSAGHDLGAALHRQLPGHRRVSRRRTPSGTADLGRGTTLLQPVPADLHHPLRNSDPQRSPAAVLDPAQHPGPRLVPHPETGSRRPAVDGEEGLHQPARPGRAARHPAFDRAGPLVAPGRGHPVAAQRRGVLRAAVHHRAVAARGARPAGR